MGRYFGAGDSFGRTVCDECGYTEHMDGDDRERRDMFSHEDNEAYCQNCMDAKGITHCTKCGSFFPSNNGAVCQECR